MKTFILAVFCAVVAVASAGHGRPEAHIPSGWIGVSKKGAVIAGPAGSVRTDNGLHGHGAGAQLSGPAGDVRTRGGHVELDGPGIHGHGGGGGGGGWGGNDGGDGGWGGNGGNGGGNGGGWGGHGGTPANIRPWGGHVGLGGGWGGHGGW